MVRGTIPPLPRRSPPCPPHCASPSSSAAPVPVASGRRSPLVRRVAAVRDDVDLDLVDLVDADLPAAWTHELGAGATAFVQRIERADAVVVVTPEYNHSFPASLKQAIDISGRAWARKPVAFV